MSRAPSPWIATQLRDSGLDFLDYLSGRRLLQSTLPRHAECHVERGGITDEEAEGNQAHPLTQDDIRTEDYPSFCADMLTLDHNGNVMGNLAEGDENG